MIPPPMMANDCEVEVAATNFSICTLGEGCFGTAFGVKLEGQVTGSQG